MINGLWTVSFASNTSMGAGVVVVNGGDILGGDSGFTYVGSLVNQNGVLTVRINVDQFIPGATSVFSGLTHFTLVLTGKDNPSQIQFTGNVEGMPNTTFMAVATKHRSQ